MYESDVVCLFQLKSQDYKLRLVFFTSDYKGLSFFCDGETFTSIPHFTLLLNRNIYSLSKLFMEPFERVALVWFDCSWFLSVARLIVDDVVGSIIANGKGICYFDDFLKVFDVLFAETLQSTKTRVIPYLVSYSQCEILTSQFSQKSVRTGVFACFHSKGSIDVRQQINCGFSSFLAESVAIQLLDIFSIECNAKIGVIYQVTYAIDVKLGLSLIVDNLQVRLLVGQALDSKRLVDSYKLSRYYIVAGDFQRNHSIVVNQVFFPYNQISIITIVYKSLSLQLLEKTCLETFMLVVRQYDTLLVIEGIISFNESIRGVVSHTFFRTYSQYFFAALYLVLKVKSKRWWHFDAFSCVEIDVERLLTLESDVLYFKKFLFWVQDGEGDAFLYFIFFEK